MDTIKKCLIMCLVLLSFNFVAYAEGTNDSDDFIDESHVKTITIDGDYFTDSQDFLNDETVGQAKVFYVELEEDIRQEITFTSGTPYIDRDGRMRVPVREIAEQMGYTVDWYPQTKQIIISKGDFWYTLTPGDNIVACRTVNFVECTTGHLVMDCSPVIIDGVTYLPLRHIANILNYEVVWDETTLTAELYDTAAIPVETGVIYYDLTYAEPVEDLEYIYD